MFLKRLLFDTWLQRKSDPARLAGKYTEGDYTVVSEDYHADQR